MTKIFAKGAALTAAVIGAVATVSALPSTASAQQYYNCDRSGSTVGGAVVGGIAGALLGSGIAARGHRSDGAALGGVLGAATGAAVGNSSSGCAPAQYNNGYYNNGYAAPAPAPAYDNRGRPYYDNTYYGEAAPVYAAPPVYGAPVYAPPPVVVAPPPVYYYGRPYYRHRYYGW